MDKDPLQGAIYDGVKRSIVICLDNGCFGAAVALTYSGIDTMAFLGMAEEQQDVKATDFIAWCDRYLRLPGSIRIPGIEWYAARCALLHTYTVESKLSRQGRARKILYSDHAVPEIVYQPGIAHDCVLVSIRALTNAFFEGIDRSLIDVFKDSKRREIAEARLQGMLVCSPYKGSSKT